MSRATAVRIGVVVALGVAYACYADVFRGARPLGPSDFVQPRIAGGLLLHGQDPYAAIGPDRRIPHQFYLIWPAPAAVASMPFTLVPQRIADDLFVGLGVAVLAWALTRRGLRNPQLLVFGSFAMSTAAQNVQWAPYLTAATVLPSLGFLYACKPSVGLAYFVAYPSRRALMGAAAFALITVAIWPWWPLEWLHALRTVTHMSAPVTRPGGPLLLLAALRWRRPEARLLGVLACIPHTPVLYEALPLFLAVETLREGLVLSVLMLASGLIVNALGAGLEYNAWMTLSGQWMVWLVYLPCLVMVLRRPNAHAAGDVVPAATPVPVAS